MCGSVILFHNNSCRKIVKQMEYNVIQLNTHRSWLMAVVQCILSSGWSVNIPYDGAFNPLKRLNISSSRNRGM